MRKRQSAILLVTLVLIMLVMPLAIANAATELGTELVTNGGAEAGTISGWTDDTGAGRWAASTTFSDWPPPAAGSYYFFLYNPSMDTPLAGTMSQVITLSETEGSGLFSSISAGNVSIKFSVSMFQKISADNEAKVILEEYAADDSLLKTSQVVNTTSSGTAMGAYQINTQVNPGTRKLKVILSATLTKGGYAEFDQVSLKLVDASSGSAPVFGPDFPASAATDAGVPYTVNFTITDADPGDIDKLTFSTSSTNINLVPAANITVTGSGGNRTLRVVPASNLFGETDITVTASDGIKSADATFHLIVQKVISMGTNLVENGNGTSGLTGWSGNTINITATGDGFRTNDPNSSMSQNIDISKFASLIDGGETVFQMSAAFPNTYGKVTAQFYTDIACTNPVGSSSDVTNSNASLQQKIPANAKGVKITFSNTHYAYADITVRNISFQIINDFPKIAPISAQEAAWKPLTVPVYAYYTTTSATLTASSSDQTIVTNSGIIVGGSGFNQSVTFTPLKDGTVTITLTLNDGSTSASTSFNVTVHDPTRVVSVDLPAQGFYGAGGDLDFTVHFNDSVSGGTGSKLPLSIGENSAVASYLSSTAKSITYRYTINGSHSGAVSVGAAIDDTSSAITDGAGYDAEMELNVGATGVTVVRAPQITSTAVGGSAAYGTKITFTAALTCAEPLSGAIQFKANGTNLGSPVSVSSNTASYETSETTLVVGDASITAAFVPSGSNIHFASLTSSAYMVTIGEKALTISGVAAVHRSYDGTAVVALTGGTLVGVEAVDSGSVGFSLGQGVIASQKAENGKSVSTSITLTGPKASNYSLTQPTGITVDISKATLSVQNAIVCDRSYDGTTAATVSSVTFNGIVSGETLESGVDYTVSGVFNSANVGNNIPVTVSVELTGTEKAKNYMLSFGEIGSVASIMKKAVTISGVTAANRPYDGTVTVMLTGGTLAGVEAVDSGSVGFSFCIGTVTSAKAENAKPVSTNFALTGAKASNYSLTQPAGITVNIGKASLSIQSASVLGKIYDGTAGARITGVTFGGLAFGESLTAGVDYTASGTFDSADAGINIPVTVSVTLTDTEKAKNYSISATGSSSASITQKTITISGVSAVTRTYDGTVTVALTGGTLAGVEAADSGSVGISLGTGTMMNAKAENAKPVSTNITLTGAKASNYSLTQPTGITVDIGKAALGIQTAVVLDKDYDGTTDATILNVVFNGLAAGESLTPVVDYTASGVFDRPDADTDIPVTISVALTDTEKAKNYVISGTGSAKARIAPVVLTGVVNIDIENVTGQAGLIDEGDVLRVNTSGVIAPGALTLSYQWYRNGAVIAGATTPSYTVGNLSVDPAGTSLTAEVTGTGNYAGMLESAAIAVNKIPLGGSVSINGSANVGSTLVVDISALTPAGATYDISWMRNGAPISSANSGSYTVTAADRGKVLSVVITAIGNYAGTKSASINIWIDTSGGGNPYVPTSAISKQKDRVIVDLTLGSTLLSPAQVNHLIALNANQPVVMRGNGYTITFPKGSMESASGWSNDLDMGVSFNTGSYYAVIKSAAGDDFILMLAFRHSGRLPGKAQISIYVGAQYAGQMLRYLYYNPQTGKLEHTQTAMVEKNGYMTVTQDHCSSYAITLYGTVDIPKTGESASSLLGWLLTGIAAAGILKILAGRNAGKKSVKHE